MRLVALLFMSSALFAQPQCSLEVIAGIGSPLPNASGPATQAELLEPTDVRVGPDGLLYIADAAQHVIWRVRADQTVDIFAGTGEAGSSGDGGPARAARLNEPRALAFAPDGDLYVLATGVGEVRIRRIRPDGVIQAYAGDGTGLNSQNYYRPGMTAAQLPVASASAIAAGPNGSLYVTLPLQHRVVRVNADGTVTPFAGRSETFSEGGVSGDGGPATEALLDTPADIAVDAAGAVYIADRSNRRIRRVRTDGVIETASRAGQLDLAGSFTLENDAAGRIYVSSSRIYRLAEDGTLESYFNASPANTYTTFSIAPDGAMYAVYGLHIVRGNPADGSVTTVAGIGSSGAFGDGGPAMAARFLGLNGLAVGGDGEVYVVDSSLNRVRVIRPGGMLERFAGSGEAGFDGDGGPAIQAKLHRPAGVALDGEGRVWIADYMNGRIRRVDEAGVVQTIAGNGAVFCSDSSNPCGDGGPAIEAAVPRPTRVFPTSDGSVWIRDDNTLRRPRIWLRRISGEGTIDAAAPLTLDGSPDYGQAISAAATPEGTLLVFARDQRQNEILFTFAAPMSAEADLDLSAFLRYSSSMVFGPNGVLYAADGMTIRRVVPGSQVATLTAHAGTPGAGEAPIVVQSQFRVTDLAVGPDGDLYFTDSLNQRVYRLHKPAACALPLRPEVAIQGIRHGASFEGPNVRDADLHAAPGQILAIFGRRLGPAELAGAQVVDGKLTTSVGGVRVLVDGRPAPMIYASAGQLGAIVPYATEPPQPFSAQLQVEVDGVLSEPDGLRIVPSRPGIFTLDSSGGGPGAILNQDTTLNTAANPAKAGEVIVLWATGEGQTDPPGVDGLIAADVLPKPRLAVSAQVDGIDSAIAYAGAAPGLTAGVMQVNIVLPSTLPRAGAATLSIRVGDQPDWPAQRVTVFVEP